MTKNMIILSCRLEVSARVNNDLTPTRMFIDSIILLSPHFLGAHILDRLFVRCRGRKEKEGKKMKARKRVKAEGCGAESKSFI